jgi:hypothetical protein
MADPHALTMSRNGTRSGRESVCLPPPSPSLGCPRLPPSGVADSHAGRTRTTKPGEITIRGPVRTHPSWSARCDRHRSTTGDGLYAVQGIAKGRSSCRSLARPRSTRHESAWCEPPSCIVIDLCSSKASRVPESRNPRPRKGANLLDHLEPLTPAGARPGEGPCGQDQTSKGSSICSPARKAGSKVGSRPG